MTPQQPDSSLRSNERRNSSFTEYTVYILLKKLLFSNSCPPCVFSTHATQTIGSCRTRAPPSLSGLWRRESLLRILALLHHNTHDVSTFHTHFYNNYHNLLDMHGTKLAHHGAQEAGTRPLGAPERPQLAASSPCKVLYSFFFTT